ncbi:MAG: Ferredoxin [Methanothrix sp.]|nr:MAG: Ferredoxin [Methanothrix sp.]
MVSDVYFASMTAKKPGEEEVVRVRRLFSAAGFDDLIGEGDLTAIKLHFGERGNETYVKPGFVCQVADAVKESGGRPFLTDTATLYRGGRENAVEHLLTAMEHGFDLSSAGAPLIIADGLLGENFVEVEVGKSHLKRVKIASDIAAADSMIVVSHFKGHGMAGFGGAIKNLGMGCAPPIGKADQHRASQPLVVEERCTGCGNCSSACPESAVRLEGGTARIDPERCVGCGACLVACPEGAMELDWGTIPIFVERMVDYAFGAVMGKDGRVGFFNFVIDVTPDCDCLPWSGAPIVPDVGVLASKDPVAIDAASLDLVNGQEGIRGTALKSHHGRGEDKFRGVRPEADGRLQIKYGEEIGLGSSRYRLIDV